jgi:hypothetical protein
MSLADLLIAQGLNIDPNLSDEEAARQISQAIRQAARVERQLEQVTPELQEYRQNRDAFEAYRSNGQSGRNVGNQALGQPGSQPDSYDSELDQYTKWDPESQMWVPKSQWVNPEAAIMRNEHEKRRKQALQKLQDKPVDYIMEQGLQARLEEMERRLIEQIEQKANQRVSQTMQSRDMDAFFYNNRDFFFETDESGEIALDEQGNPRLSSNGMRYQQLIQAGKEKYEFTDPMRAHNYAMDLMTAELRAGNGGSVGASNETQSPPPGTGNVTGEGARVVTPDDEDEDDDEEDGLNALEQSARRGAASFMDDLGSMPAVPSNNLEHTEGLDWDESVRQVMENFETAIRRE